jgi:hypothetical protein
MTAQRVGAALKPAGVPDAHGLGGDAELAGDLGLAEAEGEQFGGAQPPRLKPFTFVVGRGAAGKGWHGPILPVGWSSSNSSPQPDRWPL